MAASIDSKTSVNLFFGKIVLVKVEHKENFTIYAASLSSSYGDGRKQYLLAFIPSHLAIRDSAYLSDLDWQNVQTRLLTTGYSIPSQRWELPRDVPIPMFNLVNRTDTKTQYTSEDRQLEMVMIHDPKKKSQFQYHSRINLVAALTSFRCVISIDNSPIPVSSNTQALAENNVINSFGEKETMLPF
jgi:hypothetical protein